MKYIFNNKSFLVYFLAILMLLIYSATQVGIWGDESFILVTNDHFSAKNNLSFIDLIKSFINYEPHPLLYNYIVYLFQTKLNFGFNELVYRLISIAFWLMGTVHLVSYIKEHFDKKTFNYFIILILLSPALLLMAVTIRSYALLYMLGCFVWTENLKENPSLVKLGILSFLISQTHYFSFVLLGSCLIYYSTFKMKYWKNILAIVLPSLLSFGQLLYLVIMKSKNLVPDQINWFPKATLFYPFHIFYQLFQGNILAGNESIHPLSIPFAIILMSIAFWGIIKIENKIIKKQIFIMLGCIGLIWLIGMGYKNYSIPRAFIHFTPPFCLILAVGFSHIHRKILPPLLLVYMLVNLIIFQKWFDFYQFSSLKKMSQIIIQSRSNQFIVAKQNIDIPILKHYVKEKLYVFNTEQLLKKINSFTERPQYNNFWYISYEHETLTKHCKNNDFIVELVKFHPYFKLYNIKRCTI